MSSLKWWGLWSYFWGGVLFALGGIVLYWFSPANMAISLVSNQALFKVQFAPFETISCLAIEDILLSGRLGRGTWGFGDR